MKRENRYILNELFTNELRFFIMTIVAMYEEVDFTFLKQELDATDGNLSVQLRKLEEAGYLRVKKQFINRKPKSTYSITKEGLAELRNYLDFMENIKSQIRENEA